MSAKTKIVVVKMKHVILTGVLLGILLLLIIFAATYFFSGDEPKPAVEETGMYTPGVYNTSVALGGAAIDVSVAVDSNNISYANTSQYTSKVLLDAIDNTLSKAKNSDSSNTEENAKTVSESQKEPGDSSKTENTSQ